MIEGIRDELAGRHERDALEGAKSKQTFVARDDVVDRSRYGGLQDAVVALVADSRDHTSGKNHHAACFNEVRELLCSVEHLRELRISEYRAQLGKERRDGSRTRDRVCSCEQGCDGVDNRLSTLGDRQPSYEPGVLRGHRGPCAREGQDESE